MYGGGRFCDEKWRRAVEGVGVWVQRRFEGGERGARGDKAGEGGGREGLTGGPRGAGRSATCSAPMSGTFHSAVTPRIFRCEALASSNALSVTPPPAHFLSRCIRLSALPCTAPPPPPHRLQFHPTAIPPSSRDRFGVLGRVCIVGLAMAAMGVAGTGVAGLQYSLSMSLSRPRAAASVRSPVASLPSLSWGNSFLSQTAPARPQQRIESHVAQAASSRTDFQVKSVPTKPIEGQKTGTSGLRKKVKVFMEENYLANWIQALFDSIPEEDVKGSTIVLGGDGRYFNKEAAQIIIKIAAANGVGKIMVGKDGIISTPAVSAIIRQRKADGGFIMSASHNPAGPDEDWGIKYNYKSGQPAPESITDKIYDNTMSISEIKMADFPDVDLASVGSTDFGSFTVEVIDPVEDYLSLLKEVFDFDLIRSLLARPNFRFKFDAMHAVTGAYAKPIFIDALGASEDSILNGIPKEDFGGGHPDPNLTYAHELVEIMYGADAPVFGAASDGDGDRNMILGDHFFVTPSDSVAVIAANAQQAIPYFKTGLKGLARSMPTSGALDAVAKKLNLPFFEVPTGWKFFGNLMDAGQLSVCGEESFGTGSDHIREKDGIWAVLAWLNILAHKNCNVLPDESLVSVADIVMEHWATYGRNFFVRYDYESCESEGANKMVAHLREILAKSKEGDKYGDYTLKVADDFTYTDPVDGSVAAKQGIRFVFTDGSRIIFRLSGTGSAGATIRLYVEKFEADASNHNMDAQDALKPLIDIALSFSKLREFTGREKPTVIT